MLYFAYGSNMSAARLTSRIPSARLVHIAALTWHELRFHKIGRDGTGKCDAFHTGKEADSIMGAVYKIDPAAKEILDGIEKWYEPKEVEVVTAIGEKVRAFTYCAVRINEELRPYDWYMHHVVAGANEHGFSEDYIEQVKAIEVIEDTDLSRREMELSVYRDEI